MACLGCGSAPVIRVRVESIPSHAAIFVDGKDSGLVTPAEVDLPLGPESYLIEVRKAGFASVQQELNRVEEVFIPDQGELWTAGICGPFCLGLPLISLLWQVENPTGYYAPLGLQLRLPVDGQGAIFQGYPPGTAVLVDGERVLVLEDAERECRVELEPGPHDVAFVSPSRERWDEGLIEILPGVFRRWANPLLMIDRKAQGTRAWR